MVTIYHRTLYVSRKEGGRELVYFEDCVDAALQGLEECTKNKYKLISK